MVNNNNQNPNKNQQKSFKIFLGSLPPKTTKSLVLKTFAEFGSVKAVYLQFNRRNKFCKGSGYIVFNEKEAFERVLDTEIFILKRKIFKEPFLRGRKLKIKKKEFTSKRIFVTDIPCNMSDGKLGELFRQFGRVEQAYRITCCNGSKQPYGFVLFRDSCSALKCHKEGKVESEGGFIFCRLFEKKDEERQKKKLGDEETEVYVKKGGKETHTGKIYGASLSPQSKNKIDANKIVKKYQKENPKIHKKSENFKNLVSEKYSNFCKKVAGGQIQKSVSLNLDAENGHSDEDYHYPKISEDEYLSGYLKSRIERNHKKAGNLKINLEKNSLRRLSVLKGHCEYHHGRRYFF